MRNNLPLCCLTTVHPCPSLITHSSVPSIYWFPQLCDSLSYVISHWSILHQIHFFLFFFYCTSHLMLLLSNVYRCNDWYRAFIYLPCFPFLFLFYFIFSSWFCQPLICQFILTLIFNFVPFFFLPYIFTAPSALLLLPSFMALWHLATCGSGDAFGSLIPLLRLPFAFENNLI